MSVGDEVIIAFELNKLVCFLTNIVKIEVISVHAVSYYHLAVCSELIVTRSESRFCCGSTKIYSAVLCYFVSVGDEVIITIKLNKLVCFLTNIVKVEVISVHAVSEKHLTVCTELIISGIQSCLYCGIAEVYQAAFYYLVSVGYKIVIAVDFYKLICKLTNSINIKVIFIYAGISLCFSVRAAVVATKMCKLIRFMSYHHSVNQRTRRIEEVFFAFYIHFKI